MMTLYAQSDGASGKMNRPMMLTIAAQVTPLIEAALYTSIFDGFERTIQPDTIAATRKRTQRIRSQKIAVVTTLLGRGLAPATAGLFRLWSASLPSLDATSESF